MSWVTAAGSWCAASAAAGAVFGWCIGNAKRRQRAAALRRKGPPRDA